jgi:GNAT superfamily N-acetyltransferase
LISSALEIVKASPSHQAELSALFKQFRLAGYENTFHPHALTAEAAERICAYDGKDFYCVLLKDGHAMGYGLLRGWDEGYRIPRLGIALAPQSKGSGFGECLMNFLHAVAKSKGSDEIQLRVYKENQPAISLYKKLGYKFTNENDAQLLGTVSL